MDIHLSVIFPPWKSTSTRVGRKTEVTLYRGKGRPACRHTGYCGRRGQVACPRG